MRIKEKKYENIKLQILFKILCTSLFIYLFIMYLNLLIRVVCLKKTNNIKQYIIYNLIIKCYNVQEVNYLDVKACI